MSNYNGVMLKLVEDSLASVLKNTYPNLEVILVDNASTDNSIAVVQKKFGKNSKFKLLQNPINMYSLGLNLGIKNSTGKYIAFFNNDAIVENGYFEKLVAYLERNPNVALIQGKLLSSTNHAIIDCAGETMDIFGNPKSIGHGENNKGRYDVESEILSVSGSCSVLRKSVVETVGYFDNDYGIGYEDMDLSLRARFSGYRIIYYPSAYVYHKRGATDLSPMIRVQVKWHFNKNRLMTLLKNFPIELLIIALPVVLILYVILGIGDILHKNKFQMGITRFTAIFWVVGNIGDILKKRSVIQNKIKRVAFLDIIPLFLYFSRIPMIINYLRD